MSLQADLDHIALDCKVGQLDVVRFYTDVVGFEEYRVEAFKRGAAAFPSVRVSAVTILDFFQARDTRQDTPRKSGHFCFALRSKKDFDALVGRLRSNHVKIKEGPAVRSGARGDGISVYFEDPDGNLVEARYYPEDNPEDKEKGAAS